MARESRKHLSHEEAEETRRTILRTAHQLFMEHGYRAVTTRQIADACGLTQPALYHYFSDKQDLYVAVMLEDMAKTKMSLERIARRNESVEGRLRHIVRYLLGTTHHNFNMMIHDIRQEIHVQAQQRLNEAFQASMIAPIASIFQDGFRQGVLRDQQHDGVDAQTATWLFMSMLSRFLSQPAHFTTSSTEGSEHAEGIVKILLYGMAYPDATQHSYPAVDSKS